MPTSKTSLDFKLIAVRILPGCVQHIRKCFIENRFYYLNNDYRISEDGKHSFTLVFTQPESNLQVCKFPLLIGKNCVEKSLILEAIIDFLLYVWVSYTIYLMVN